MIQQDAAGLTQLSSTVEDVFASGDLPRAAETLANMRHCLSAVGEVLFLPSVLLYYKPHLIFFNFHVLVGYYFLYCFLWNCCRWLNLQT